MINSIYLRRSRKLIIQQGNSILPKFYIATAMKNMECLGFTFSRPLIEALRTLPTETFAIVYERMIEDLKRLVGAHVRFKPMYPNFPAQVMEAGDAELYMNARHHYMTLKLPGQEPATRPPMRDQAELKVIELGDLEDFKRIMLNLIQAKTSISETDKEDLAWAIATIDDLNLPSEIPLKENVGFVVSALLGAGKADISLIRPYFKTATDVLRLAVSMSDGDVSLAEVTRFRNFKRTERRLLLQLLEQCGNIAEDMLRYKNRWLRLGERLHPGEYKTQYPKCLEAFDILRNSKPYETFGAMLELSLQYEDTDFAMNLLVTRPGEFARRLDHLLRLHPDYEQVIARFGEAVDQVSTPVLLQVMTHFKHRNEHGDLRTFFPKGNVSKAFAALNRLPRIDKSACDAIVHLCQRILMERFSALPPLGKVYIDEQLKNYVVPFSQRSAGKSLRTIVRGSRVPMPEGDTIRFFLWWKEGTVNGEDTGRVDIDLSAVMYDGNWDYMEHISYTNLRSAKYKAAHSGDITSAPHGACEFIDIDIPSVLKYGGRYVVASLNSFTEQPYCNLPECFAGWMIRKSPGSGEVFEPSLVADKIDVAADTRISIPVILDLQNRMVIWCDLALKNHPNYYNNIESNRGGMALMGKAMVSLIKPDLYELLLLHATARGELAERPELADQVFSPHEGITPFDIDRIMAEFIA
ncbi:TerD family protein [Paenibacillus pinihumi]|uniref:TerD family protein n=1 Tax=Paenibacillus pinihumi TaxID=669462 RepID=UPI00048E737E|nr:TerD family protein [Paenibacillus pinihumi]